MLPRNKWKRELANLLTLKNRTILIFIIAYLCIGSVILLPGDSMSPGNSDICGNEGGIDNYASVRNYPYDTDSTLKEMEFFFVEEVDIPGMPRTCSRDYSRKKIFSEIQNLQGLCVTDDFYLISSDSDESGCLGELMVFDVRSGEYLLTMGMDEKSHLGGIAYDGENVWICNSDKNTLERISYDTIRFLAFTHSGRSVNITNLVDTFPVKTKPSCVAYDSGSLWIATHSVWNNARMYEYIYDDNAEALVLTEGYHIPKKVQGVTFDEDGRVYLSVSYGRRSSSYLKVYESVWDMSQDTEGYSASVEMPPCSEEIMYMDGKLYILFESAGKKYLEGTDGFGRSLCPIDKILVIDQALP